MSGEVAFACEISEDRRKAAVVASGREQDGTRVVVDLVWYDHPRGAVGRLVELSEKHDPVAVVVDPRSQAATLLRPLADAGVFVTEPGTADVVVAHGEFLDLVRDGMLAHLEQPPLTSAVRAAQQRPLAGAGVGTAAGGRPEPARGRNAVGVGVPAVGGTGHAGSLGGLAVTAVTRVTNVTRPPLRNAGV